MMTMDFGVLNVCGLSWKNYDPNGAIFDKRDENFAEEKKEIYNIYFED